MASESSQQRPPWEVGPKSGWAAAVYGCSAVLLLALSVVAGLLFVGVSVACVSDLFAGESGVITLGFAMGAVILFTATAGLYRLSQHLDRQQRGWQFGTRSSRLKVEFTTHSWISTVDGPGSVEFRDGRLAVHAKLGVSPGPILFSVLLVMVLASWTGPSESFMNGHAPSVIAIILVLIGLIVLLRTSVWLAKRWERFPFFQVKRDDIRCVHCHGSFVTLRLARPPGPWLRRIQFFVVPDFSETFFAEFERTFPGLLPEAYRRAVSELRHASS